MGLGPPTARPSCYQSRKTWTLLLPSKSPGASSCHLPPPPCHLTPPSCRLLPPLPPPPCCPSPSALSLLLPPPPPPPLHTAVGPGRRPHYLYITRESDLLPLALRRPGDLLEGLYQPGGRRTRWLEEEEDALSRRGLGGPSGAPRSRERPRREREKDRCGGGRGRSQRCFWPMRNIYLGTRRPREHEVNALFSASLLRAFHLHNFCFRRWRVWPLGRGRRLRCQLSILNLLKLYLFISLPCGKRNVYSSFRHDLGFSLFFSFHSFLLFFFLHT